MDIHIGLLLFLVIVYFFAGFVDSVSGGGGALALPALLLAGFPVTLAAGTNKLISACGTSIALFNFVRYKKLYWNLASIGILCSLIGSYLGSRTLIHTNPEIAIKIIIFCLPIGSIIALIPKKISQHTSYQNKYAYLSVMCISLLMGFYDGFFGPGTGSFLILAFSFFLQMDTVRANALAKAVNLASNISALVFFALHSQVLYMTAIPLIIANMLGGFLGSKMAIKKGSGFIRIMISLVFIALFILLVAKYFGPESLKKFLGGS